MSANPAENDRQASLAVPSPVEIDPLASEIRFLSDLRQLATDRAAAETQIEAQLRARTSAAERAQRDAREGLIAQLVVDRADMESDYAEQRSHALARYQHETTTLERQFAELQEQVAADYDRSTKRAARKLKDARWEAETLFEASKDVAPRRFKEFQENLQTWLARVAAEQDEARQLLSRWKQAWNASVEQPQVAATSLSDAVERLKERVEFAAAQRVELEKLGLPPIAAGLTIIWIVVLAGLISILPAVAGLGAAMTLATFVVVLAAGIGARFYLRELARAQIERFYPLVEASAAETELLAEYAHEAARAQAAAQQAEIAEQRGQSLADAEEKYQSRMDRANRRRDDRLQGPALNYPSRLAEIAECRDRDLELAEGQRARRYEEIQRKEADGATIEDRYLLRTEQIQRQHSVQWQTLVDQWKAGISRLQSLAADIQDVDPDRPAKGWLADLSRFAGRPWSPATAVPPAVRFGQFRVPMDQVPDGLPRDLRLAEALPSSFTLPALVPFPARPSLLFKARGEGRASAIAAMQAVMLRLLVSIPPGKLRLTIIDPVGLGENFAAFMHLADYNEALVTSRIWTEPKHIEERLADLSEHMENVIQKYLRNDFPSIEAYNREAGEVAEPYRFLVIASFPANFTEAAQRRLMSIVSSGPRCGVYTLIMADTQMPLPAGISLMEIERTSATLVLQNDHFAWQDEHFGLFELALDVPPSPAETNEALHAAARHADQASRVEVPFEVIAPPAGNLWTHSAKAGIDVPLGRAGATRLQSLKLGQGTSQHVLIAGKTGSGKSTLLHALITNLALRYSPDEVELYLVDFKQGVEFKTYATHRLPHARVVAVESDREFGVSVLARLDAELRQRAEAFRAQGVQDLAAYRAAAPVLPMPRIVLVVDEFQEFFVDDDKIAQDAALLLDRLVRQGRAFGIHVLLGSQTLAGTYTLARSTIGQMAVRIALQCSETDAHLILSEENSAARLLSRAGEAIYNDTNGLVEGNHPFQIVWLSDDRRESYLEELRSLAEQNGHASKPQVVFEGNVPPDPEHNQPLNARLLAGRPTQMPMAPRAWLGDAVAIKDPTSVTFARQNGNNLLVVSQNEDAALGIVASMIMSLAAQSPAVQDAAARFYVLDGSPVGSDQARSLALVAGLVAGSARVVSSRELASTVGELSLEVEQRLSSGSAALPPIFIFVVGLQKLRELRRGEEDFGFSRSSSDRPTDPSKQFASVLRDGPTVGVHAIVWCDSVNNLSRTWDRQTLREFELRVAFQMSANDSSTLLDTPLAGKLGAHRALLHNEEQGTLDKFRPYRWPSDDWLRKVRESLQAEPRNPSSEHITV